jgi:hypothetical protein
VVFVGPGPTAAASCLPLPRAFNPYAPSGSRISVHRGVTVWAVEGEPEKYVTRAAFPWLAVRSSDARVLAPIRLCTSVVPTFSIPERVYAFEAKTVGSVRLSDALASQWRSASPRPAPYRAVVTVRQ